MANNIEVTFTHVARIEWSRIRHYPKTEGCAEFFVRDLIVTATDGQKSRVPMFAPTYAGLANFAQVVAHPANDCKCPQCQPKGYCEHCSPDGAVCVVCGSTRSADAGDAMLAVLASA